MADQIVSPPTDESVYPSAAGLSVKATSLSERFRSHKVAVDKATGIVYAVFCALDAGESDRELQSAKALEAAWDFLMEVSCEIGAEVRNLEMPALRRNRGTLAKTKAISALGQVVS